MPGVEGDFSRRVRVDEEIRPREIIILDNLVTLYTLLDE